MLYYVHHFLMAHIQCNALYGSKTINWDAYAPPLQKKRVVISPSPVRDGPRAV